MIRSTLVGLVIAAGLIRPALAEEVKFGFVDFQRALNETEDGRKALASLKKIFDQKQNELKERMDEITKAGQDLDKKRTILSAETVRQKEGELREQAVKVQEALVRHQQEIDAKQIEATRPIGERLQRIISKIGAAEKLTMVLRAEIVVFAGPHMDLTDEVIRRYNAGEEKVAPPAGSKSAPSKKK